MNKKWHEQTCYSLYTFFSSEITNSNTYICICKISNQWNEGLKYWQHIFAFNTIKMVEHEKERTWKKGKKDKREKRKKGCEQQKREIRLKSE